MTTRGIPAWLSGTKPLFPIDRRTGLCLSRRSAAYVPRLRGISSVCAVSYSSVAGLQARNTKIVRALQYTSIQILGTSTKFSNYSHIMAKAIAMLPLYDLCDTILPFMLQTILPERILEVDAACCPFCQEPSPPRVLSVAGGCMSVFHPGRSYRIRDIYPMHIQ